jgi:hypothetical protein
VQDGLFVQGLRHRENPYGKMSKRGHDKRDKTHFTMGLVVLDFSRPRDSRCVASRPGLLGGAGLVGHDGFFYWLLVSLHLAGSGLV